MQDLYALLCLILGLPIGLFFYWLINQLFDIHYFGCGAVWGLFWGCLVAGAVVMFLILEFLGNLAFPIAFFFLIVWLIARKKKKNQPQSPNDNNNPNQKPQ